MQSPSKNTITSLMDKSTDIENEISKMHILPDKLCPGAYGSIGIGLTVAERFEELLKTGPKWVSVKKKKINRFTFF